MPSTNDYILCSLENASIRSYYDGHNVPRNLSLIIETFPCYDSRINHNFVNVQIKQQDSCISTVNSGRILLKLEWLLYWQQNAVGISVNHGKVKLHVANYLQP